MKEKSIKKRDTKPKPYIRAKKNQNKKKAKKAN